VRRRARSIAAPEGGFRNIAILRLSSLGDVVLTLPAVRALKRAHPAAALHFWTRQEYADVVRFEPALSHVRALEPDALRIEDLVSMSAELEDCDLIVDLHGSARTRVLTFRQRAPVLRVPSFRLARARRVHARWSRPGVPPGALERYALTLAPLGIGTSETPRLEAGDEAERWAARWLEAWGPVAPPVALCPGARHFTKRWPESHWVELDTALERRGLPRLYFSLARERDALPALGARVASAPGARWCVEPLPRMMALLSRCRAAVTCDSGLMHVAAARGVRVVALFGSTAPELGFAPAGEGHAVLCRREPCQPCTLHGRATCPRRHFRCMTELRPGEVLAALEGLAGPPAPGGAPPGRA